MKKIGERDGDLMIEIGNVRISLDKKEAQADIDFISHAHSDHISAAKLSNSVFASEQTMQLVECAYNIKVKPAQIPTDMALLSAGHMLGSKQLCINDENSGMRIVYTGDFQMERSRASEPITIPEADCVILDSTYYDPMFSFKDKSESEAELIKWVRTARESGIVLFSAYSMGKAQELISILNTEDIVPVVSKKISRINKVYESNGMRLRYASAYDLDRAGEYDEEIGGNFVGITERRNLPGLAYSLSSVHGRRVYTAIATGFSSVFDFDTDAQFPISDHADFQQSIDYIDATGAKYIYTYGGSDALFARNLSKRGYIARPLPDIKRFGDGI